MRIVHVVPALVTGGAQTMLAKLLESEADAQDQLVVALRPGGGLWDRIAATGAKVESLGLTPGQVSPAALWRLARLARGWRADVVHGWMYHGNLAAQLAAGLTDWRIPVIWNIRHSLHDLAAEKPATRRIIRFGAPVSRFAAEIVYNSAVSVAQHQACGYAATAEVIPNGFDLDRFRPDAAARAAFRTALGLDGATRLVGLIARDHPMKDHASMLRAAGQLADEGIDLELVLVGEGVTGTNTALLDLTRAAGLAGRVHLLGERSDVPAIMAALDVLVLCSAWGEGFPNVLGEAMACGVPCVATDVGDCRMILAGLGELVPPREPEALAAALRRMLDLPAARRLELGAAGRRRVATDFSLPAAAARYRRLYQRLATGTRRRGAGLTAGLPEG